MKFSLMYGEHVGARGDDREGSWKVAIRLMMPSEAPYTSSVRAVGRVSDES